VPIEATGKIAGGVVDSLKGTPIVLALLLVILGTLVFVAYLMGVVASAAGERNKQQLELIQSMVKDIRDCRSGRTELDANGTIIDVAR
jgi:hypothetical protein